MLVSNVGNGNWFSVSYLGFGNWFSLVLATSIIITHSHLFDFVFSSCSFDSQIINMPPKQLKPNDDSDLLLDNAVMPSTTISVLPHDHAVQSSTTIDHAFS